MADQVEVFRSGLLAGIPHGFLGRKGGVSEGIVAGLNVGFGADDDLAAVAVNRARASEAVLPGARLVSVHQIHSPTAVYAGEGWPDTSRPVADALVTDRPGLLLGIVTADCAPVLLADAEAGVVAAAHAGWKGAHLGVIGATVAKMVDAGANAANVRAVVGPCIAVQSYEVDEAFRERLAAYEHCFEPGARDGHWQFNLRLFVQDLLLEEGVGEIDQLDHDTYAGEQSFYSYRRSTHRHEPNYGRQFSLIGLPG